MSGTITGGDPLSSALLGVPAWTAMSLLNGWTNSGAGNVTAQWRKLNQSNEIEIIGTINAGTLTNGTNIAQLTTYLPVTTQFVPVMVTTSTGSAGVTSPRLFIDTSGNVQVFSIPASTTAISFHGTYSLDA